MKTHPSILPVLLATTLGACAGAAPAPPPPVDAPPREAVVDLPGFDPVCSKAISRRLQALKQPVTVRVYVSRRTPSLSRVGERLTAVLRWFERAGGDKVVVEVLEPTTEKELAEAEARGLQPFEPTLDSAAEGAPRGKVVSGVSFAYGEDSEAIPLFGGDTWPNGLRGWVASKFRELEDRVEGRTKTIGVVAGKEEIKLSEPNLISARPDRKSPTMLSVLTEGLPFYRFEEIDLRGGDTEIRSDLAGLLITQPGKPYLDRELRRIDELVMKGKPLAVFASAVNLRAGDPSMRATLATWSLERLLGGYGIEMRNEALLDWGGSVVIPVQQSDGTVQKAFLHGLVVANSEMGGIDTSSVPFFAMDEIAFPYPSPLVPHPEKQPDATMRVLARSSPRASVDASETLNLHFRSALEPKSALGSQAMAVALEGKIRSAFGGQGISAEPASPVAVNGRVLVVGSSQFLVNPLARAGNPADPGPGGPPTPGDEDLRMLSINYALKLLPTTILTIKLMLDWMTLEDDDLRCYQEKPAP